MNIEAVPRSGAFQAIQIAQPDESVIRLPFPFCAANSSSTEKSISRANSLQNNSLWRDLCRQLSSSNSPK